MYLTRDDDSKYEVYEHEDMKGVRRLRLVNPDNSSSKFAVRTYIISPGGHTSFDVHPHEHVVYMLSGEVMVSVGDEKLKLVAKDVLHIDGNESHQFKNLGKDAAKFICVRDFTS